MTRPPARRRASRPSHAPRSARALGAIAPPAAPLTARTLAAIAMTITALAPLAGCRPAETTHPVSAPAPVTSAARAADWPVYAGDAGGSRFSLADEITPANVARLQIAWTFHTGDVDDGSKDGWKTAFQATPILHDGTLYFPSPLGRVFALDAETGAERWRYDTKLDRSTRYPESTSRGVAFFRDPAAAPAAPCAARILYATLDARLFALDARTGTPCSDFGDAGHVDLRRGVDAVDPREYVVTSPPVVLRDLVVVGSGIGDNQRTDSPRGIVRAFDVRTGALRWSFDPIPKDPSDPVIAGGRDWKDGSNLRTGSANAWSILSVDAERDLVFAPTGSASPDYYGGERRGDNRHANSVVALRGATGAVVWSRQLVHHDLWDYDVPAQPVLTTLQRDGAEIPVVVQATKMGLVFVLHRETGEPMFPIEERPVPQSDVPGEESSPTQPFPIAPPPLVPHTLRPEDAFGLTPWDRAKCREKISKLRNDGIYTPPSLQGSLAFPSVAGGTNWGSVAVDAARQRVYLNTTRAAFQVRLVPRDRFEAEREAGKGRGLEFAPQQGTPYGLVRAPLLGPFGIPCNPPPWGTIAAVDLARGTIAWESTLGTTRDLAPVPIALGWGTPNLGGPLATAGGLVFIGAAMDDYLRAFDAETGAELWKGRLPAGGQATPMTYRLSPGSRQFVVIAAGGHGKLGTRLGDALVAWTLAE